MNDIAKFVKEGKIGVLPLDPTLGLVGSALNPEVVERIYEVRGRALDKPFIVMIAATDDVLNFGVDLKKFKDNLVRFWPGHVSIILPVEGYDFKYLHRGLGEIAFRCPRDEKLRSFLRESGSMVVPSANLAGEPVAESLEQAKAYFGDNVDFYAALPGVVYASEPSALIKLDEDGGYEILRAPTKGDLVEPDL